MPSNGTGQQCKLPDVEEELIGFIRDGLSIRECSLAVGIHYNSYDNWMRKGKKELENDEDTMFTRFVMRVYRTNVELMRECMKRVRAGEMGWQGAKWVLEANWPKAYATQSHLIEALAEKIAELEKLITGDVHATTNEAGPSGEQEEAIS